MYARDRYNIPAKRGDRTTGERRAKHDTETTQTRTHTRGTVRTVGEGHEDGRGGRRRREEGGRAGEAVGGVASDVLSFVGFALVAV